MVTSRVGIASQFLQNAYVNGEQAARSLDELARNALFSAYFGGNTRVRTTLGAAGPNLAVDDVRGFQTAFVNGVQIPVSGAKPLHRHRRAATPTRWLASPPTQPTSRRRRRHVGRADILGNVSVADGTAGNAVVAANASAIVRPSQRANTSRLIAGDTLTMSCLLDAVAKLRAERGAEIDGVYNCYLDPVSARQLFADPDFRQLFQGATSANQVFRQGMVNDFLGLRFIPTTKPIVSLIPRWPACWSGARSSVARAR